MSKYHNIRMELDGHSFDSMAEANHYQYLMLRYRAGEITRPVVHPRYQIAAAYTGRDGKRVRAKFYEADFEYYQGGQCVTEDVKGVETPVFKLKRHLFELQNPNIFFRIVKV